jgi:hypothetical protein
VDDSVLILDTNPQKFNCFCFSSAGFIELIMSIGEIEEFGVTSEAEINALVASFNTNAKMDG